MMKAFHQLYFRDFQITPAMKKDILVQYDKTADQLLRLVYSAGQEELNTIPFEGSWTAAQVVSHITQSNQSIVQALNMPAKIAERKPDIRVEELKTIFLDFTTKLKSPDFILPKKDIYNREILITDLEKSIANLKEGSRKVNLSEAILHAAFGDITKLELLHFVVYHTQRHIHQLQHIFQVLENR
jgi:DinB superfamily